MVGPEARPVENHWSIVYWSIAALSHRGVHDAGAVGAYGVGDVTDVDGVQVLVVARLLNKDLWKKTEPKTRHHHNPGVSVWHTGPHPGHKQ